MQLALYTPNRGQALQQAPETRPAVTAEWLKQLPTVIPEEAAQKLLAELGRLNRSWLEDELRAKLTRLFEPVVFKLTDALVNSLPEQRHATISHAPSDGQSGL